MAKYDLLVSRYYGISFASKHSHHDMISFGLYREQIKRLHKVACLYGMNMDQAYAGSWKRNSVQNWEKSSWLRGLSNTLTMFLISHG